MKRLPLALVVGALLMGGANAVGAQNLTASSTITSVNTQNHISTISFTPGADTGGFDFTLTYDVTEPGSVATTTAEIIETIPNGTASCTVVVAGTINCIANANDQSVDLAAGTITIAFDAGAAVGIAPLTFTASNFFSQGGTAENGTTTNGQVDVRAAPPGPTAPVIAIPGAVTIPTGSINTVGTVPVTIDTTTDGANGGNATVSCSIPAGAAAFTASAVTGNPFVAGTGSVTVGCTRGATDVTGTLTCNSVAGGGAPAGTQTVTSTVTCQAGTVQPEVNVPTSATLSGAPGTTANGSVLVQNTGTAPLTFTCGAPSAGFTVTTTPTSPVAAGGSTSIGLSCVTPAIAGSSTTGTLVCTTNDSDEATVTIALSCVAQVVDVPVMGSTGKALLASLLAAVGLLGFALRRKLV